MSGCTRKCKKTKRKSEKTLCRTIGQKKAKEAKTYAQSLREV